jgi:hypothetical protein
MSVDDLLKKGREIFRTGPDFHQIRLRVLVLVFDLIYMERRTSESSIPLYTYLAKLKLTRLIIHRMQEN